MFWTTEARLHIVIQVLGYFKEKKKVRELIRNQKIPVIALLSIVLLCSSLSAIYFFIRIIEKNSKFVIKNPTIKQKKRSISDLSYVGFEPTYEIWMERVENL